MTTYLDIYDLNTGNTTRLMETDRLIEAPNWTPDGDALIVNGDGRLYRVALDTRELTEIDSGFADRCNNDKGISPDGATIALSHHLEDGSCIFTIPAEGGAPTRVTDDVPSYWHGWSPDGARLVYTAKRGDTFGICTIAASGGEETRVSFGDGFADGPDYTPDGEWIWFNATYGGTMQLWRIRPDGTGREQMTDDERVNWFPHPNPVSGEVLYLAYENGVEGHPRDHEVELRLLTPETGEKSSLLPIFGGQGSINVPCWHPDGTRFAFVHYARP